MRPRRCADVSASDGPSRSDLPRRRLSKATRVRESEAAVLAVAQGQGQIGTGYYAFFPAVERGAKVVALMELAKPAFVLLAQRNITDVKTLNGMQVATHSAKSSQKILFDFFLVRDYPGVQPVWVYMPAGSPARAAALLSGSVKAATMDISAASTVLEKAPGQFHTLIDTTKVPVSNFFLIASRDFAAKNQPTLTTIVKPILESYRQGRGRSDVLGAGARRLFQGHPDRQARSGHAGSRARLRPERRHRSAPGQERDVEPRLPDLVGQSRRPALEVEPGHVLRPVDPRSRVEAARGPLRA